MSLQRYFSHIATWKQEITILLNRSSEHRTSCSASQDQNHYTTTAPKIFKIRSTYVQCTPYSSLHKSMTKIQPSFCFGHRNNADNIHWFHIFANKRGHIHQVHTRCSTKIVYFIKLKIISYLSTQNKPSSPVVAPRLDFLPGYLTPDPKSYQNFDILLIASLSSYSDSHIFIFISENLKNKGRTYAINHIFSNKMPLF